MNFNWNFKLLEKEVAERRSGALRQGCTSGGESGEGVTVLLCWCSRETLVQLLPTACKD